MLDRIPQNATLAEIDPIEDPVLLQLFSNLLKDYIRSVLPIARSSVVNQRDQATGDLVCLRASILLPPHTYQSENGGSKTFEVLSTANTISAAEVLNQFSRFESIANDLNFLHPHQIDTELEKVRSLRRIAHKKAIDYLALETSLNLCLQISAQGRPIKLDNLKK